MLAGRITAGRITAGRTPAGVKPRGDGSRELIAFIATVGCALLALATPHALIELRQHPAQVIVFVVLTLALQLLTVEVYGRGSVSVAGIGALAIGFVFGVGVAMWAQVLAAIFFKLRTGARTDRTIFNAASFALAAAAGTALFRLADHHEVLIRFAGACGAGLVFCAINFGLLTLAMSRTEGVSFTAVWQERFNFLAPLCTVFGPLAFAATLADERIGLVGVLAFFAPPALLVISMHQYVARTKASVIELRRANDELRETHLQTIAALSRSMEAKDGYTGSHTERVSEVAVALASRLGYAGAELEAIEVGALLHDIGKIGIPESILHKPGPLSDCEWKVMKEHPVISDYILSEVHLHPFVRQVARWSHERIDGAGYPDGLAGDEIPLPARIVLVADAFDALTSDRPYRRARTTAEAIEELTSHAGTQFCAQVIGALHALYREEPLVLATATPAVAVVA
jgi:putative nucleotidyltransferase with HDIG domain